jgi:hypothetical protein
MSVLTRILAIFITAAAVFSCSEQEHHSSPPQALPPTNAAVVPMDLSLYTPAELRVFSARCDQEIANALARGDTNSAMGWAKVRSAVAVRLSATEVAPRRIVSVTSPTPRPRKAETRPGEYALPSDYDVTHVKVWDKEHRQWHYEPRATPAQHDTGAE